MTRADAQTVKAWNGEYSRSLPTRYSQLMVIHLASCTRFPHTTTPELARPGPQLLPMHLVCSGQSGVDRDRRRHDGDSRFEGCFLWRLVAQTCDELSPTIGRVLGRCE